MLYCMKVNAPKKCEHSYYITQSLVFLHQMFSDWRTLTMLMSTLIKGSSPNSAFQYRADLHLINLKNQLAFILPDEFW